MGGWLSGWMNIYKDGWVMGALGEWGVEQKVSEHTSVCRAVVAV